MSYSVRLQNISKMYRIYDSPKHKLKEALLRGFLRSSRSLHRPFWALQDINLEISKGECIGIIGENGSGKSTMLQIMAGILQPTSGDLFIEGRISALLELGAGFQGDFTGRENVYINGAILGISREEIDRRFDDIAAFADIGEFIDQPVKIYSSGMFVRLAFATAVNVNPDILIIDEALAVGDIMFRNRCYSKMDEIRNSGKTIIFVSHDMNAVRTFCDRAVLMDKGRILEVGKSEFILNAYNKWVALKQEEYARRLQGKTALEQSDTSLDKSVQKSEMEYRYGFGEAEIIEYQLWNQNREPTDTIQVGHPFIIRSRCLFSRKCHDPSMGIILKTIYGAEIFGINTLKADSSIGEVEAGEIVSVEFHVGSSLNPGEYKFSVGVSENMETGLRILDQRIDVSPFKVIGKSKSFGMVYMDTSIKIEKNSVPVR